MKMQMMSCITVSAIIDFVWLKSGMQRFCNMIDIRKEGVSLFICQFCHFTDVFVGRNNDTSLVALFLEQIEL
ncbi:hypothetical protein SDC9_155800 [bioreactor metagenome]|uniref:Uncharacterized protein n=1 Tax=bioreactor metagenome TaxID=1076179 RepID=A0A645F2H4_9ZZZZ